MKTQGKQTNLKPRNKERKHEGMKQRTEDINNERNQRSIYRKNDRNKKMK